MRATLFALLLSVSVAIGAESDSCFCVVCEYKSAGSTATMTGHGSGTAVRTDGKTTLILTNRHVIEDATGIWIIKDGIMIKGRTVFINDDANGETGDVAGFIVDVILPVLQLASANPQPGDTIHHYGATSHWSEGKVSTLTTDNILSSCLSNPGDSGAALLDSKGMIVGLNWGRYGGIGQADTKEIAVPVKKVRKVLEKYGCSG